MNPAPHAPAFIPAVVTSSVQRAFATLTTADQRLLEAIVFDGYRCTEIAQRAGVTAREIRARVGAAMLALHAVQMRDSEIEGGAVAAMLAARALDALDDDEAAVIDALVEDQPRAMQLYTAYREVVGELSLMVTRVVPTEIVAARLGVGAGCDDVTVN